MSAYNDHPTSTQPASKVEETIPASAFEVKCPVSAFEFKNPASAFEYKNSVSAFEYKNPASAFQYTTAVLQPDSALDSDSEVDSNEEICVDSDSEVDLGGEVNELLREAIPDRDASMTPLRNAKIVMRKLQDEKMKKQSGPASATDWTLKQDVKSKGGKVSVPQGLIHGHKQRIVFSAC